MNCHFNQSFLLVYGITSETQLSTYLFETPKYRYWIIKKSLGFAILRKHSNYVSRPSKARGDNSKTKTKKGLYAIPILFSARKNTIFDREFTSSAFNGTYQFVYDLLITYI